MATAHELRALGHESALEAKIRRQRVEVLGLPHCRICGGAQPGVTDEPSLLCDCAAKRSELQARMERLAHRHSSGRVEAGRQLADAIAP